MEIFDFFPLRDFYPWYDVSYHIISMYIYIVFYVIVPVSNYKNVYSSRCLRVNHTVHARGVTPDRWHVKIYDSVDIYFRFMWTYPIVGTSSPSLLVARRHVHRTHYKLFSFCPSNEDRIGCFNNCNNDDIII